MKNLLLVVVVLWSSLAVSEPGAKFEVSLTPAGDFTGKISKIEGFATISNGKIKATEIRVPLKDLKTGIELRDTHTKKYLEVEKFPFATLLSGEGENGKGSAKIEIRGVKKDYPGTFTVQGNELTAIFKVSLSDIGISGINYKGVGVENTVAVSVTVGLKKAAGEAKGAETNSITKPDSKAKSKSKKN